MTKKMKKKYKKRIDKIANRLSDICVKTAEKLLDISLDKTVEFDCEYVEKDKTFYYEVKFTLPVMKLKWRSK